MPEPETVSVGDVSRQAIERLQGRVASITQTMGEVSRISADLQDQMRQLLSYCESQDPGPGFKRTDAELAYSDVADKLRNILDGE